MVEKAAVERGRKEKKRKSTRSNQTVSMANGPPYPLSIYLLNPQGERTKRLGRREPKIA
jgi:hypothetical protein